MDVMSHELKLWILIFFLVLVILTSSKLKKFFFVLVVQTLLRIVIVNVICKLSYFQNYKIATLLNYENVKWRIQTCFYSNQMSHSIIMFSRKIVKFNNIIRFDGISVENAKSTTFDHWNIYHLAIYLNRPFTTGSYVFDAKTEIMRLESGEWKSGPDYPFHPEWVWILYFVCICFIIKNLCLCNCIHRFSCIYNWRMGVWWNDINYWSI